MIYKLKFTCGKECLAVGDLKDILPRLERMGPDSDLLELRQVDKTEARLLIQMSIWLF
jgi:hypothetical protein